MYILSHKKYYDYYRRGIKKIIPRSLIPVVRPKIIEILYDNNGKLIGNICGTFLKDYNKHRGKNKIIDDIVLSLNKLKNEHIDSVVFEEMDLFNNEDIQLIEKRTKLKVLDGMNVLIYFLPIALKKIYNILDVDLKTKEVLIIGDNEDLTIKVIESISNLVGFITLTGRYDRFTADRIYQYVLDRTGLSIFYSKNVEKILTNYSIIINLIDNYNVDIIKIRNEALIFDFSPCRSLKKDALKTKRSVIDDFVFKEDNFNLRYFAKVIYSRIYETAKDFSADDFKGLSVNNSIFLFEDFVNEKIKNKGKL